MSKGYLYILECSNGTLYTGSTIDLERRLKEHKNGNGANHTKRYPPKKLLYIEEFDKINLAYKREKQIQRWSKGKKLALIEKRYSDLRLLAECMNESHFENKT